MHIKADTLIYWLLLNRALQELVFGFHAIFIREHLEKTWPYSFRVRGNFAQSDAVAPYPTSRELHCALP